MAIFRGVPGDFALRKVYRFLRLAPTFGFATLIPAAKRYSLKARGASRRKSQKISVCDHPGKVLVCPPSGQDAIADSGETLDPSHR